MKKTLAIVLLLVGSCLLFVDNGWIGTARSAESAWDLGHVIFFILIVVVLDRLVTVTRSWLWHWFVVLVGVTILGFAIEILQSQLGRTNESSDLVRNAVGALLGLTFFQHKWPAPTKRVLIPIRVGAIGLLLSVMSPLIAALYDEAAATRAFPVLADFESPFQLSRWESDVVLSVEKQTVRHGTGSMRVPLSTASFSKASLQHFHGDWSGASALLASVYNPGPGSLTLNMRVNDMMHDRHGGHYSDRYNTVRQLYEGWTDIQIPLTEIRDGPSNRDMDLSQITGLSFFVMDLPQIRTIMIDDVKLQLR